MGEKQENILPYARFRLKNKDCFFILEVVNIFNTQDIIQYFFKK